MKPCCSAILILSAALAALSATAQTVRIGASRGPAGEYYLDARTPSPGVWSVMVRFPAEKDAPAKVYGDTVSGARRFLTLPAAPENAKFKAESALGNAWGAVDTSILYRLPFSASKRDAVYSVIYESGGPAHLFRLAPDDTVFAVRRGIVVSVEPIRQQPALRGVQIVVQHRDGSWAAYRGVDAPFVQPGQTVWPDTPIATAAVNGKYGPSVVLKVKYPTVVQGRGGRSGIILADIHPAFAGTMSEAAAGKTRSYIFIPRVDYELITREMTPEDAKLLAPPEE